MAADSDVVLLAVKPQQIGKALETLRPVLTPQKLVVSIAAGIRLGLLARELGAEARLVRVMPNTPCLVGKGASAYCLGGKATADDKAGYRLLKGGLGVRG